MRKKAKKENDKQTRIHIAWSCDKDCYAVMWSYGMYCVSCNCCGKYARDEDMYLARLKYWEDLYRESQRKLKEIKTDLQKGDCPELDELRLKNCRSDIELALAEMDRARLRWLWG